MFFVKSTSSFGGSNELSVLSMVDMNQVLVKELAPRFVRALEKYFRLEVEGLEHLPKEGPVIYAPNHSGFLGLDAMILSHQIAEATQRGCKVLTHPFWFKTDWTSEIANRLGFFEAGMENALFELRQGRQIVIFPEGEKGNFKASLKAYQLQEFNWGFVRLAIRRKAKIIPTLILGAEESQLNLAQIALKKISPRLSVPLPLNLLPLPTRWKIVFLEPSHLPFTREHLKDKELLMELTQMIHDQMQERLAYELKKRKSIFF